MEPSRGYSGAAEVLRFVVDESSWQLEGIAGMVIEEAAEAFLDRLAIAGQRSEAVAVYEGFWDFDGVSPSPFKAIFTTHGGIADADTRKRLQTALDRLPVWRDEPALDVSIAGSRFLAPSIAYAHSLVAESRAVACLPLIHCGRRGPTEVMCEGDSQVVHFVTDESSHRAFFRAATEVERCDDKTYPDLCGSAFPDLRWADDVWGGLRDFKNSFRSLRAEVTQHLAVLDDHGRDIFRGSPPHEWSRRFAAAGAVASDENGKAKADSESQRSHTRTYDGASRTFWWHTKIRPKNDRIHFLYDSHADYVIVGIFTKHCHIPD